MCTLNDPVCIITSLSTEVLAVHRHLFTMQIVTKKTSFALAEITVGQSNIHVLIPCVIAKGRM